MTLTEYYHHHYERKSVLDKTKRGGWRTLSGLPPMTSGVSTIGPENPRIKESSIRSAHFEYPACTLLTRGDNSRENVTGWLKFLFVI